MILGNGLGHSDQTQKMQGVDGVDTSMMFDNNSSKILSVSSSRKCVVHFVQT